MPTLLGAKHGMVATWQEMACRERTRVEQFGEREFYRILFMFDHNATIAL